MKVKDEKLVKISSIFDPAITTIKKAVEVCGRSRQFIETQDLTFGIVTDIGAKVIVKDDKYDGFLKKCQQIDKSKKK